MTWPGRMTMKSEYHTGGFLPFQGVQMKPGDYTDSGEHGPSNHCCFRCFLMCMFYPRSVMDVMVI